MIEEKSYIVGVHRNCFMAGIPMEVLGIIFLKGFNPVNSEERRLCYKVQHHQGGIDHIPVEDDKNYKIISFEDILNGNIPKVK